MVKEKQTRIKTSKPEIVKKIAFAISNLKEKIKLWNKFFNSSGKSKLKYYKKLVFFKNKEDKIIMEALNKIEINKMSDSSRGFSLFPDGVVAIPTFVNEESD